MKRISLLLLIASLTFTASAQRLNYVVDELTSDGRISIKLDNVTRKAMAAYTRADKVVGYRVCIFSDNGQNARSAAGSALGALQKVSPYTKGEMIYTNPFFRVYAGVCQTKAEATVLLGKLKSSFQRAFIAQMSMTPADFVRLPITTEELPSTDGVAVADSLTVN